MTVQIRSDVKACIMINRVHLVKGQANVPMKMAKLKEVHGIIRIKEEPPFAKPYCKKTFQGINSGWYKYGHKYRATAAEQALVAEKSYKYQLKQ